MQFELNETFFFVQVPKVIAIEFAETASSVTNQVSVTFQSFMLILQKEHFSLHPLFFEQDTPSEEQTTCEIQPGKSQVSVCFSVRLIFSVGSLE